MTELCGQLLLEVWLNLSLSLFSKQECVLRAVAKGFWDEIKVYNKNLRQEVPEPR